MIDLISERVGGRVVECNDEFFAESANLIKESAPVWREGEYTDRGKWMDGWETRRRREPGHDWCVLQLGIPGRIRRVGIDTSYFTGNYPEAFSLEATGHADPDDGDWVEVIGRTALLGDDVAWFEVNDPHRVVLLRLSIYPDGGIARIRVEGEPIPAFDLVCPGKDVDLCSASVGGSIVAASDTHYSHPSNCLRPSASAGMWDGWETKRRRDDGHDWIVTKLGLPGTINSVVVDTTHYKGNAPGWVSVDVSSDGREWENLAERVPVDADTENVLAVASDAVVEQLRLSIHPDGGLARLRVMGKPEAEAASRARITYLNSLFPAECRRFFRAACASSSWVEAMVDRLPFDDVTSVLDAAEEEFELLQESDWLEAFKGHPRIGERGDPMANQEQAGAARADQDTRRRLAEVNVAYEERHGFTYIVYASGKSAQEMLAIAEVRLANSTSEEIDNAAAEQRRITATRLSRMLCQEET